MALDPPKPQTRQARAPLHLCALTLNPHSNPVAAPDGSVFDASAIVQLVRRTALNPITGLPLSPDSLVSLSFSVDPRSAAFRCPILFHRFTDNVKVVAIATTGNVYSFAAVHRLNLRPRSMRDLVNGTPFSLQDIIVLYDPDLHVWSPPPDAEQPPTTIALRHPPPPVAVSQQSVRRSSTKPNNLFHPQTYPSPTAHALHSPQPGHSSPAPAVPLIPSLRGLQSTNTQQPPSHQYPLNPLLDVLPNLTPPRPSALPPNPILPPIKKPRLTALPPADAGSTSPASQPKPRRDQQQPHPPTHLSMTSFYERRKAEDQRKAVYKRIRKGRKGKGYVRVVTNIGHLNIELHCDKVPMTCDNFLTLAERKYYDGLLWHRVIPGFIAQTGDPTGKGDSGDSAWGGHIKDEIRTTLNHDAPGVVSMANSGRDTNRSQWFISFNAAHHLDGAHTVFGKVVGGLYVLKKMEDEAEMGHPLTVERVEVLVNPIRQIRETMSAANAKPIPIPAPLSSLPSKTPPPQLNSNSSTMLTIPLSPVQTGNCEQLHSRQPPASDQMDYSPVPHSASMSKPTQLPSLHPPPQQRQPPPLSLPRDLPPASTLLTAASIHPQNPTRL